LANPAIAPGLGWSLNTHSAPQLCDGSYNSFCGKDEKEKCLLYGANDHRGGFFFDSFSGWLIVNLADFKHGLLVLRVETWHKAYETKRTEGWKCENNACDPSLHRHLETLEARNATLESTEDGPAETRHLKGKPVLPFCDRFKFEFALDGKITSWTKSEAESQHNPFWLLLDDPDFIQGEPRDVELAIRQTGCGRQKTLQLFYVYWA
jgi:hypothetical protein